LLAIEGVPEGRNRSKLTLEHVPDRIQIEEHSFDFLSASLARPGHFISVVKINGDHYIMDDLVNGLTYLPPDNLLDRNDKKLRPYYNLPITTALFYKS
jgi:hypothetical protein